jgi:hypothetical protein
MSDDLTPHADLRQALHALTNVIDALHAPGADALATYARLLPPALRTALWQDASVTSARLELLRTALHPAPEDDA